MCFIIMLDDIPWDLKEMSYFLKVYEIWQEFLTLQTHFVEIYSFTFYHVADFSYSPMMDVKVLCLLGGMLPHADALDNS